MKNKKMNEEEIIFSTAEADLSDKNSRLDKFLVKHMPNFSRAQLQRLISEGNVLLEDVVVSDNSHKVNAGDIYQIIVPPAVEAEPLPENIPLDIVYEDEDLLVVNKPAGMTVHPAAGVSRGTLVNALLFHCKDSLSGIGGVKRPGIVHRIDRETSGLLVVAKNDNAHRFLSDQFAEHSIERTYWAVVYGIPNPLEGRIEGNIGRSPFDRKKMAIVENGGKRAVTNYKTLKKFKNATALDQCNLETGRTHQIRVHLTSVDNALIGDKVYVKSHKTAVPLSQELKNYINNFPNKLILHF